MKRLALLLVLALVPACGFFDSLFGDDEHSAGRGPRPGEPISSEQLVSVLPAMDDWNTQGRRGEVTKVGPDEVTVAHATYQKKVDDKLQTLKLEVMDGNHASAVYSPFAVMAHSQGQVADAHKMQIDIAGNPGFEEWKPESGSVRVLLLVGRRFVITLHGENIPPGAVRQTLEAVDLNQLTTWATLDGSKAGG